MGTTNFENALEYEKSRQPKADLFYKEHGFSIWQRPDWHDKEGRKLQRDDIDVILSYSNDVFDISPKFVTVSEKFRQHNYDDICLEIYDKIDPKHYRECKADWLAYWKGNNKVVFMNARKLEIFIEELREYIDNNIPNETIERLKECRWYSSRFKYKGIPIEMRSIPSSFREKSVWKNLIVFIEDKYLQEYILECYDISQDFQKS